MKQLGFYLLGTLLIFAVLYVNYEQINKAPDEAKLFLESQGYSNVKMNEIAFLGLDLCSKSAVRVRFEATKSGQKDKGYVCVEPLFSHSIHNE